MNIVEALHALAHFDHAACNSRLQATGTLAMYLHGRHGAVTVAPPSDTALFGESVVAAAVLVLSLWLCIWSYTRLSKPHASLWDFSDFRIIAPCALLFGIVLVGEVWYEWQQYINVCLAMQTP